MVGRSYRGKLISPARDANNHAGFHVAARHHSALQVLLLGYEVCVARGHTAWAHRHLNTQLLLQQHSHQHGKPHLFMCLASGLSWPGHQQVVHVRAHILEW